MSNLTITAERREPAAFTGLRAGMTRDLALSSRPPDELNVPSRARSTTSSVTLDIDGVEVYAERREVQMLLWRVDVGGLLEGVSGRDYAERCMEVVRTYGRPRRLAGTSSSSLGQRFGDHDAHTVVLGAGTTVEEHLPWLTALYRGPFLAVANALMARAKPSCPDALSPARADRYTASPDVVSAINLNLLRAGERYEWHVDTNALTGLLFCPQGTRPDESELHFRSPEGVARAWHFVERPAWGRLLLFDARKAPHHVRNVQADRVTVPMNYEFASAPSDRPADLDGYLYG